MSITQTLERAFSQFPAQTAVEFRGARLTYRELWDHVSRLARVLCERGSRAGDRIALLAPNVPLFLEGYYAAAHAGLVLVPLNVRAHPEGLANVMSHAQAECLIAHESYSELAMRTHAQLRARGLRCHVVSESELNEGIRNARPLDPVDCKPDDAAQLYFTSGTTGDAKGVILTHRNVTSHALMAIAALNLSDGDCWGHIAPMFHLADAWATFAMTWVGGRHRMVPSFDVEDVLNELAGGITITNLVPTMLSDLVHHRLARRQYSLRAILSGGAPIAAALVDRVMTTFGCEYVQTYGLTETSPYLTMSTLPKHIAELPVELRRSYVCKTGRPIAGVQVEVVREDGTAVVRDDREVGEIRARGESVTPGYWNNPAASAAAIRDGWFYTGDLAVMDRDGFLNIVDRKKDVIKTGGETVYSTEVEGILCAHPKVQEAAAIGVPHERWGEAVVAVIVARAEQTLGEAEILAHCRSHLGSHQVPKRVMIRASLPRTGSGKVAKRLLRSEYAATFS